MGLQFLAGMTQSTQLYPSVFTSAVMSSPERRRVLNDRRAVSARNRTRLVSKVAKNNRLCSAAMLGNRACFFAFVPEDLGDRLPRSQTLVVYKPVSHLLEEILFIFLVFGPAHMKEVGRLLTSHNFFHKLQAAMKMKAARKEFALEGIPSKDFDFEPS
jgi:hypothetical protein